VARRPLLALAPLVLGLAALGATPAAAAPQSVQMRDNRYTPSVAQVGLGQRVSFTNFGQVVHDAVDDTGLGLFRTDVVEPPESATIDPLPGAGRFAYVCTFHPEMVGRLDVPVTTTRSTSPAGAAVTIRWAPDRAQGDLAFDVQRRRPGTARFEPWRAATLAAATRWWPVATGTWAIRARVRNIETGESSAWSAATAVRVVRGRHRAGPSWGTTISAGRVRSNRNSARPTASRPPTTWATTKAGTELGAMPAKVSLRVRPTVTAGLANEVDEVNQ
jgi:plastocyanin